MVQVVKIISRGAIMYTFRPTVYIFIILYRAHPGIKGSCLEKCNFGFSKSSKFKRVVHLILMTFCLYVQ